jgi:hypothetical protein
MKAINYISILALLATVSCTSALYTGVEYDDIYYQASDQPVVVTRQTVGRQIEERDLKSAEYYDNIYASDTLMSDEYYDALDYEEVMDSKGAGTIINNNYYYDDYFICRKT